MLGKEHDRHATTSSLPGWKLYWPAKENHFCVLLML